MKNLFTIGLFLAISLTINAQTWNFDRMNMADRFCNFAEDKRVTSTITISSNNTVTFYAEGTNERFAVLNPIKFTEALTVYPFRDGTGEVIVYKNGQGVTLYWYGEQSALFFKENLKINVQDYTLFHLGVKNRYVTRGDIPRSALFSQ